MNIRKRLAYCRVIWKKGLLLLPRFLIAIICITGVLAAAVYGFYTYVKKDQIMPRARVAVVTVEGDLLTMVGATAVANMDSVKQVAELKFMSEADARAAMADGNIEAAIYLTEDIYHDISDGKNTPVLVQISSKARMGMNMFEDLLETAMTLLHTGQASVYALESAAEGREVVTSISDLMDLMADQFVDLALNRSMIWESTLLSPYGDITSMDFYIMTMIMVITIVFLGMGFGGLYDRRSRTVEQCIRRTGIGPVTSALARVSVIMVVLWALMAIVCFCLGRFSDFIEFKPVQLVSLGALAFSMAGLIHLVHSLVSGSQGTFFYLLITIMMFVAGGGLFAAAYLPGPVQKVVPFLPVELWQTYLSQILWGSVSQGTLIKVLLAGAGLITAGSICSELITKRG